MATMIKSREFLRIYNVLVFLFITIQLYKLLESKPLPRWLGEKGIVLKELNVPAIAFEAWNRTAAPFPCVPQNASKSEGFYYIKIPKAASSTLGHMVERIANREAKRQNLFVRKKFTGCKIHEPLSHLSAIDLDIKNRDKDKSFVWTLVRHPADRLISHYAMNVRQGFWDTSEHSFLREVQDKKWNPRDFQLDFVVLEELSTDPSDKEYLSTVQSILNEYNFIGVYERFYESLVVLSMIADIPITDILFNLSPSRCGTKKRPGWVTPNIEKYLSGKFTEEEKGDHLLYNAANRSLDLTIEKLGHQNVQKKLELFTRLIAIGSKYAEKVSLNGCGVKNLGPRDSPFADMDQMPWFNELSPEDQKFVQEISLKHRSYIYSASI